MEVCTVTLQVDRSSYPKRSEARKDGSTEYDGKVHRDCTIDVTINFQGAAVKKA